MGGSGLRGGGGGVSLTFGTSGGGGGVSLISGTGGGGGGVSLISGTGGGGSCGMGIRPASISMAIRWYQAIG